MSCKVGEVCFRITLDSGCARNFICAQFCRQLEKSAKTLNAVKQRRVGNSEINCTGITSAMRTPPVQYHSTVVVTLEDVPEDGSKGRPPSHQELVFAELEGASDCLLVGFPTMLKWRPTLFEDEDGHPWVYLQTLNVSLPCEVPSNM